MNTLTLDHVYASGASLHQLLSWPPLKLNKDFFYYFGMNIFYRATFLDMVLINRPKYRFENN